MAQQTPATPTRIIRRPQVQDRTGLSRSSIYAKLDRKSEATFDPTFPKPVSIGARAVGWIEVEVEEWLRLRVTESRSRPCPKLRGTARRAA
jgi:prophage regulatory protein